SGAVVLYASGEKTIGEAATCAGPLYERLARPLWLAALNIEPTEASAGLAGAVVREAWGGGGKGCRPVIARDGLGHVFIEPAMRFLGERNVKVVFGHRLRALDFADDKVAALDFGDDRLATDADAVILAVPPIVAADLVTGLKTPSEFRAIVNAHFRLDPPPGLAPIIGIVHGTIQWLFTFADRLSITISAADRLLDAPREMLAQRLWHEVAAVAGLPKALPPWQIVL